MEIHTNVKKFFGSDLMNQLIKSFKVAFILSLTLNKYAYICMYVG